MRHLLVALPIGLAACAAPPPPLAPAEIEAGVARSAAIADRFQAELLERLQSTIATDGMVAAIHVCAEEAPAIAGRLSAETGASVRRTALRHRNPAAAPDRFEAVVMESWAAGPLDADGRPRQQHVIARDSLYERLRYMRAIPTAPQCLACHGPEEAIAPAVRAAIAERYPDDRATGFRAGELRGAFSIGWRAEALRAARAGAG